MVKVKKIVEIPERLLFEILGLPVMGIKQVNNLFKLLLPSSERERSEKILDYLRIYTHLVSSLDKLSGRQYKRSFDHLQIIKNLLKESNYKEEDIYYKKMSEIVNSIIAQKKELRDMISEDENADPLHIKTKLLLAQNICILRILKISK